MQTTWSHFFTCLQEYPSFTPHPYLTALAGALSFCPPILPHVPWRPEEQPLCAPVMTVPLSSAPPSLHCTSSSPLSPFFTMGHTDSTRLPLLSCDIWQCIPDRMATQMQIFCYLIGCCCTWTSALCALKKWVLRLSGKCLHKLRTSCEVLMITFHVLIFKLTLALLFWK